MNIIKFSYNGKFILFGKECWTSNNYELQLILNFECWILNETQRQRNFEFWMKTEDKEQEGILNFEFWILNEKQRMDSRFRGNDIEIKQINSEFWMKDKGWIPAFAGMTHLVVRLPVYCPIRDN